MYHIQSRLIKRRVIQPLWLAMTLPLGAPGLLKATPDEHDPTDYPHRHEIWMEQDPQTLQYHGKQNPLPVSEPILVQGRLLFLNHCANCHGTTATGHGSNGDKLLPPPTNLAATAPKHRDEADYIYWTIAEGGMQFATDMPAFKEQLSEEEIWSLIHYLNTL